MNFADVHFGGACTEADRGGSATIGVQMTAELATQVSCNTPWLQDQTALLWSWPGSVATIFGGNEASAGVHTRGPSLPHLSDLA